MINAKLVDRFTKFCYLLNDVKLNYRHITKSAPAPPKKRCRNQLDNNSWNFNVSKDVKTPMYYLDTRAVKVSEEKLFTCPANKAKKMHEKRYNSLEVLQYNLSSKGNTKFYNKYLFNIL